MLNYVKYNLSVAKHSSIACTAVTINTQHKIKYYISATPVIIH